MTRSYEITRCSVCSDFYLGDNICSRCKEAIARDEAMALEDGIVTVRTWAPVPQFAWQATRGDYDLGAKVGFGATERAAIDDLLELEAD